MIVRALKYATASLFRTLGPDLGTVTLRRYVRAPSASSGRTAKTLAEGFPKTVKGIVAEARSGKGEGYRQVLVKGGDLGSDRVPAGEWTVQETAGGPELPLGEEFRPMGPSVDGVVLWKARIGSGGTRDG